MYVFLRDEGSRCLRVFTANVTDFTFEPLPCCIKHCTQITIKLTPSKINNVQAMVLAYQLHLSEVREPQTGLTDIYQAFYGAKSMHITADRDIRTLSCLPRDNARPYSTGLR